MKILIFTFCFHFCWNVITIGVPYISKFIRALFTNATHSWGNGYQNNLQKYRRIGNGNVMGFFYMSYVLVLQQMCEFSDCFWHNAHSVIISLMCNRLTFWFQMTGTGLTQMFTTHDPKLTALGLPQYPPLPGNTDPAKIEEIRRTVYVGNLAKNVRINHIWIWSYIKRF